MASSKIFGETGPCYGWWLRFKQRHPESIKLRKPDSLDGGRVLNATVTNLRSCFQLLHNVLQESGYPTRPQDVYNCDETIIDLNKSSQTHRVVIPHRMKVSHLRQVASSEHISIHCCVSVDGAAMPPFVIFKGAYPGGRAEPSMVVKKRTS